MSDSEKPSDVPSYADAYAAAPPGGARLINELHESTGLPMLRCREALLANGWDLMRALHAISQRGASDE